MKRLAVFLLAFFYLFNFLIVKIEIPLVTRKRPGVVILNRRTTMNIIKAERRTVKFCEGVEVDGYMLPDGEFRVGKVGASVAIGYGKDWLGQLGGKTLKGLQSSGFTGSEKIIKLDAIHGGGTTAKTISLPDFRKLIIFAASKGKPQAVALLDAVVDVGLDDWFRGHFGQRSLTLDEKRGLFYHTYSSTINWLEEDREDWRVIEEQQRFLQGN